MGVGAKPGVRNIVIADLTFQLCGVSGVSEGRKGDSRLGATNDSVVVGLPLHGSIDPGGEVDIVGALTGVAGQEIALKARGLHRKEVAIGPFQVGHSIPVGTVLFPAGNELIGEATRNGRAGGGYPIRDRNLVLEMAVAMGVERSWVRGLMVGQHAVVDAERSGVFTRPDGSTGMADEHEVGVSEDAVVNGITSSP